MTIEEVKQALRVHHDTMIERFVETGTPACFYHAETCQVLAEILKFKDLLKEMQKTAREMLKEAEDASV